MSSANPIVELCPQHPGGHLEALLSQRLKQEVPILDSVYANSQSRSGALTGYHALLLHHLSYNDADVSCASFADLIAKGIRLLLNELHDSAESQAFCDKLNNILTWCQMA